MEEGPPDRRDPSVGRSFKRQRVNWEEREASPVIAATLPTKNATDDSGAASILPPEVWASVIDCLDYQSVLSCAATSTTMLRDALPLVTTLHIEKYSQLNALASRFRDVREVNIFSLLSLTVNDTEETSSLAPDYNTVMRVVPFLSRFRKLEQVFFGGRSLDGNVIRFQDNYIKDFYRGRVNTLIDLISEAYQSRMFPESLCVLGLICPLVNSGQAFFDNNPSACRVCQTACQKWPLESVIHINNKGSSTDTIDRFGCKRPSSLDVCLTNSQINNIIRDRSNTLRCPETRLFALLGQGDYHEIISDARKTFFVVDFPDRKLSQLRGFINSSKIDTSNLDRGDVANAIMKSFKKKMRDNAIPPKERCYLTWGSFKYFKESFSFPIDKEDFLAPLLVNEENMPLIVKAATSHSRIQHDCMKLLYEYFSVENGCERNIQCAVDLGVVPLLVDNLCPQNWRPPHVREESADLLGLVARNGNDSITQALMEAGAPSALFRAVGDDALFPIVGGKSIIALGKIAKRSAVGRDAALQAGAPDLLLKMYLKYISGSRGSDLLGVVSLTLLNFCQGEPRPDPVLLKSCTEPIYKILLCEDKYRFLQGKDVTEITRCCSALCYICHGSEEEVLAMVDAGVYARLVEFLVRAPFAHSHPDFQAMVAEDTQNSQKLKSEVLDTISRLIANDNLPVDPLVNDNVLSILMSFMAGPDLRDRFSACNIIARITEGTGEQMKTLINHACIRPLCGVLSLSNTKTTWKGLSALSRILHFSRSEFGQSVGHTIRQDIQFVKDSLGQLEAELKTTGDKLDGLIEFIEMVRELNHGLVNQILLHEHPNKAE